MASTLKTVSDRLAYSASGKDGFMACETCAEGLDEINRLKGEAGVWRDLLTQALGVIETIDDGESDDWMMLTALKTHIKAMLEATA